MIAKLSLNHKSLNNVILVWDYKAFHLGHSLNTNDKDSIVSVAITQFWSSFNLFRADFWSHSTICSI